MALTVTNRKSNVVGNLREVTMIVAGDTSGSVETGLKHVLYANLSGWGTSDVTFQLYKNSTSAVNDNDEGGSVYMTNIANTALGYRLKAVGV